MSETKPDTNVLRTDRLVLRRWRGSDLEAFAAMSADPLVMEHLPSRLDRGECAAMAARIEDEWNERRLGRWAVEVPGVAEFIGLVGLSHASFEATFTPCVEIGWRIAREHLGKGYATEAALAALADGFQRLGLDEIVSFTVKDNARSHAVMQRIGMIRDEPNDFDHPSLPDGHRLRRHLLYRLPRSQWLFQKTAEAGA